jgi:hypothetical protein
METTTRYLLPALMAPPSMRAAIDGHPRAYLAATLTTCFRGSAADPLAGQLREHALAAKEHLGGGLTLATRTHLVAVAQSIAVGVDVLGVGAEGVDLRPIGEAVVVGVGVQRVGAGAGDGAVGGADLLGVGEAVVVGVGVANVGAEPLFEPVGEAVGVVVA